MAQWLRAASRARQRIGRQLGKPVLIAFAAIFVMLLAVGLHSPNFLSATYLLQQLQIAAFLGVIASGAMMVILLGHIDLSIPWVLTAGAMMSTAVAGWFGRPGEILAVPVGVGCGLLFGLVNGVGVAYLRIPSMIFTLGVNAVAQGLMVLHTGGFAPQDRATDLMGWLAVGRPLLGIPNAVWVWAAVGVTMSFVLRRTVFGRHVYAVGNREAAAYLSGVDTRLVVATCFGVSGALSGLGGVLLTGYSRSAYQSMGDAYLLPAIAAVVLGGTDILGGRGRYLGTVAGVILITLLQSILSVLQIPDAARQITYGLVILAMLLSNRIGARDSRVSA